MDGIHDLGGRQGFGDIPRGPRAEATFEAAWQRRVFGLALVGQLSNDDAFRHAIERGEPAAYLAAGYWGRWLAALELLAHESVQQESRTRSSSRGAARPGAKAAGFSIGDTVRVRDLHTSGHTRLPGYARGRRGVIVRVHGAWVFPDSNAHGGGEDPQVAYAVRFDARELWGDTAEPETFVHVDLFEPYLSSCEARE